MKPEEPANPAYVGSRYKNGSFVVQQTLQSGKRKKYGESTIMRRFRIRGIFSKRVA
jgi:hypothetical protein